MTTESFANDGTSLKEFDQFDFAQEIAEAEQQKPWSRGHFAKTLFKKSDFRVVFMALEKGSALREHHADGTISVQVLKGRVRFSQQGNAHELPVGTMLALAASIKHELEALEDSACLLTIAWPDTAKLEGMQHRGYGT